MEEYKVVVRFKDLQDDDHLYDVGDTYPREGLKPTKKRINELASKKNRRKTILLEKIAVVEELNEVENEK